MSSTLIISFVMAIVFTAGCVLIQKLERYAEPIGNLLGLLFLLCALLCAAAVLGPYISVNGRDRARVIRSMQAGQSTPASVRASLNATN